MIIRPVEWDGEACTEVEVSQRGEASPIRRTPIICHICFAKEPATLYTRTLDSIDPSLTLTRTQCPAIVSNRENRNPFTYARFASVCKPQQLLSTHS